jgi:hypothetical protein
MDRIAIPDAVASANAILSRAERELLRKDKKPKKRPELAQSSDPAECPSEPDDRHDLDELA